MPLGGVEWWLQLVVLVLLGATLFHAVRLERALGALRRDRTQLEALLAGLDASTQEAQAGLERLRGMADGAGKAAARQADLAGALRDDLVFLVDRGERLAVRLDELVRAGRTLDLQPAASAVQSAAAIAAAAVATAEQAAPPFSVPAQAIPAQAVPAQPAPPVHARPAAPVVFPPAPAQAAVLRGAAAPSHAADGTAGETQPRPASPAVPLRSQAERDLLLALRGGVA